MRIAITAILFICVGQSFAQVKSSDLLGKWTTCNKDSLYYKSEMVVLYQDANYSVQSDCCYYVNWEISSKKKISLQSLFACTEPGRISKSDLQETFKIVDCKDGQMIVLKRGKEEIDRFEIVSIEEERVDRYPYDIKRLTLKRK